VTAAETEVPLKHEDRPTWPSFLSLFRINTEVNPQAVAEIIRDVLTGSDAVWSYVGTRVTDVGPRLKDTLTGPMQTLDYDIVVTATAESKEEVGNLTQRLHRVSGAMIKPTDGALTICGQQYLVRDVDWPLIAVCLVKRLDSLTRSQFQSYWRNEHAPLGYRFPGGPGYRQLHTVEDEGAEYYDGITLMQYPDFAFTQAGFKSPDYLRAVAADEEKFLDHNRTSVIYYDDVSRH
jgi:uncharacterized protein (TIGR02118 family)